LTGFTNLFATPTENMRNFGQGLYLIPSEWRATLGGPCAVLGWHLSIVSNAQCGYGFAVFDPANVGSGNVPLTPLLNYPFENAVEPGDSSFTGWSTYPKNANGGTDLFSSTNAAMASCFIAPGSRSLLFITSHGYGVANTGCRTGSVHNDPNRVQVVAYDLRDLVAVKNGTKLAYQPKPYAWWAWNAGGVHWDTCVGGGPAMSGAGAYDPATQRWYMCMDMFLQNIHTWTVKSL
jgi:hypothetical protein